MLATQFSSTYLYFNLLSTAAHTAVRDTIANLKPLLLTVLLQPA